MPGDKVQITDQHVAKAQTIYPRLVELLQPLLSTPPGRAVVSVHGGSGVGKSEIGSLLAFYLNAAGIGAYVMSGDNYPRRVPSANDAERTRIFRVGGLQAVVAASAYHAAERSTLADLIERDLDADPAQTVQHPWLTGYQRAGRKALQGYLGTANEIDFDEVNAILGELQGGRRRTHTQAHGTDRERPRHDQVDVSGLQVIILEWTHGNNDLLKGVDVPILLNSTPEETLAHRRSRNRDWGD